MNNVELVSMNNVELASMNNFELVSMNNVKLANMNNVANNVAVGAGHDNNVVTTLFSQRFCVNLLTN